MKTKQTQEDFSRLVPRITLFTGWKELHNCCKLLLPSERSSVGEKASAPLERKELSRVTDVVRFVSAPLAQTPAGPAPVSVTDSPSAHPEPSKRDSEAREMLKRKLFTSLKKTSRQPVATTQSDGGVSIFPVTSAYLLLVNAVICKDSSLPSLTCSLCCRKFDARMVLIAF